MAALPALNTIWRSVLRWNVSGKISANIKKPNADLWFTDTGRHHEDMGGNVPGHHTLQRQRSPQTEVRSQRFQKVKRQKVAEVLNKQNLKKMIMMIQRPEVTEILCKSLAWEPIHTTFDATKQ